jgi:hypothetical protein
MCLKVADTAQNACSNKESLQIANLLACAGGAYYELNRLRDCRKAYEESYRLQELLLPDDEFEVCSKFSDKIGASLTISSAIDIVS